MGKFDGTGCSRTLPIAWNSSAIQHFTTNNSSNNVCDTATTTTTGTLLQIKREPCQVSEVTTSNNLLATTSFSAGTPTIIKIEQKSPTSTSQSNITSISSSSAAASMDANNHSGGGQNGMKDFCSLFIYQPHENYLNNNCETHLQSDIVHDPLGNFLLIFFVAILTMEM